MFLDQSAQAGNAFNETQDYEDNLETTLQSQIDSYDESELGSLGDIFLEKLSEVESENKDHIQKLGTTLKNYDDPTSMVKFQADFNVMQATIELETMFASKGVNMIDSLIKMN